MPITDFKNASFKRSVASLLVLTELADKDYKGVCSFKAGSVNGHFFFSWIGQFL